MKAEEKVIYYIREGLREKHGKSYDKLSEEQQNDLIALVTPKAIQSIDTTYLRLYNHESTLR